MQTPPLLRSLGLSALISLCPFNTRLSSSFWREMLRKVSDKQIISRRLEELYQSWNYIKTSSQDILKTSWRRMAKTNILVLMKTPWKRPEDVFWKLMSKANIFVLIKTSWRRLEDVFWRRLLKTSSEDEDERHLQGFFIKTIVFWVLLKVSTLISIATKNLNKSSYFYSYKARKNKSGSYLIFFNYFLHFRLLVSKKKSNRGHDILSYTFSFILANTQNSI